MSRFLFFTLSICFLASDVGGQAPSDRKLKVVITSNGKVDELGTPEVSLPFTDVPEMHIGLGQPKRLGRRLPKEITEKAPEGGLLVGIELTYKVGFARRKECRSLRAIYQIEDRYQYGKLFGLKGPERAQLLAEPGHVVGGCNFELFAGSITGAQLIFYPFEDGQIDKEGRKLSEPFGREMRGLNRGVDLAQPAVGIAINVEDDRADFADDEFFPEEELDDLVRIEGVTFAFANIELAKLESSEGEPLPLVANAPYLHEHELLLSKGNSGTVRYYQSSAPEGACLIGFRAHQSEIGKTFGARLVPIYQRDVKTILGATPEDASSKVETIRAKPGYVVCGCLFQGNNLRRVAFAALKPDGRLDMKDTYLSSDRPGLQGEKHVWQSIGEPIRGIKYSYAFGIDAIAFVTGSTSPPPKPKLPKLTRSGEPLNAAPYKRVWTSDRGKQVEAWLVRYGQRGVTIQREGGQPFTLPIEKFSASDVEFIQSLELLDREETPRNSR